MEQKTEDELIAKAQKPIEMSTSIELDAYALRVAHLAVEDILVMMRDSGMLTLGNGNGFVIKEKDGRDSSIMRLGTRSGLEIAIKAYLAAVGKEEV